MNQAKIYKIINLKNEMVYIGCTTKKKLEYRLIEHLSSSENRPEVRSKLYDNIRFYGKLSFRIDQIEVCPLKEMYNREHYWIEYYDSYENGLNCTLGGKGSNGYKHSKSALDKISTNTTKNRVNVSYNNLYKDRTKIEKEKRSKSVQDHWSSLSLEAKKERTLNMRKKVQLNSKIGIETIKEIKAKFKEGLPVRKVKLLFPSIKPSYLYSIKAEKRWKTIL